MKTTLLLGLGVAAALLPRTSRADDYYDDDYAAPAQEDGVVGIEALFAMSQSRGPRRDAAGSFGITLRWRLPLSDRAALAFGTTVPMTPVAAGQLIVAYERDLLPRRSTPTVRIDIRPFIGLVDLCWTGLPRCSRDNAADPHDRGAWALGGIGEIGLGWRFPITPWKRIEVFAAYTFGVLDGRSSQTETAIDGYYQGFALSSTLMF